MRLNRRCSSVATHSYLLDRDNVRHGLNRDLDFSDKDRVRKYPPDWA